MIRRPDRPADPDVRAGPETAPDIRGRAVVGVFWSAAQKWMVRASTLLAFILLGRLLSPQEFGVVALAMTIITMLGVVSDAGFTPWIIQRRRLDRTATSTAFWISTGLGVALAAGLALLSVPVADALESTELRRVLPALASTLVVMGLSSVPAALLQREMRFKELAIRQVVATVASVVVAVALALAGAGVWALVAQTLVRTVVAAVVLWSTSDFRPGFVWSRADAREMTGYGTRSLGVTLGTAARTQGEPFLIGVVLGTVALGYWAVAGRLVAVVSDLFSSAIGSVSGPVFAELQDQPERLTRTFGRVMSASGFVLVPVMTAMAMVSMDVVPFVFGRQWQLSAAVASILAGGTLFVGLASMQRGVLLGTGRAGLELVVTTGSVVGQFALVLGLGRFGLPAVAVGVSAWAAVVFLVRAVAIRREMGIGIAAYAQLLALLLAAGLAAAVVLGVVHTADLEGLARVAVVVLLGGTVYAGVALLVARPTVRDIRSAGGDVIRRRRRRAPASTGAAAQVAR